MKLYYDRKSKDPIYYIQQGIRNGKKTTTKNVHRIGKHSELLSITDDPLTYAKNEVAKYNEQLKNNKVEMSISIDFDSKISHSDDISSSSNLLNIGYFVLQNIYHQLHLYDFFKNISSNSKVTFNCNDINRFLTFDRILDPHSKRGACSNMKSFYEEPCFPYQHVERFLDVLYNNFDDYISHLFTNSENVVKRDASVCYFDCTNYYFEIEKEDPDYYDEVTGELIKGFRKYGPSKQHQPAPLVQMGLFMDKHGIPISMCLTPGSDNEQTVALPLEEKLVKMTNGKKFIYCADAGLGSTNIRKFNDMGGRAFIVTQSIKLLSDALKEAVFNDCDYKLLSNDEPTTIEFMKGFNKKEDENLKYYNDKAYKIMAVDKLIDLGLTEEKTYKNGKTKTVKSKATLKQVVIITFSRKMFEYQRNIRNKQIERARNILKYRDIESVKKGPNDVTRFIKRDSKSKKGDTDIIDNYSINEERIKEEEKYDGYYAIATNLLNDSAKDIIEISSNRYKIEDCFRTMKTNFNGRPVYHRSKEHITAHFMICYTALLIYRLLEKKLDDYGTHYTINDVLSTLNNMNVINNQDLFYQATYNGGQICTALNGIFNLGLDKKYYLPKDLNKKIKNILK